MRNGAQRRAVAAGDRQRELRGREEGPDRAAGQQAGAGYRDQREGSEEAPGLSDITAEAARGIYIAMRNCAWQTIYLLGFILLSLVPIIGWIMPLVVLIVECYYYGFSMLDYGFARNKYSTKQSVEFVGRHKGLAIGNGFLFYLTHVVIIFAPAFAIVAATLTVYKVKSS